MSVLWDFIMAMMSESFLSKPIWTANDIPDLTGKVMIMTGGFSGLGLEATKVLLARGAIVYVVCHDLTKTSGARSLKLEMADLDSVKTAADENELRLDVLYNSGGVMFPPIDMVSPQGCDLQFATHVLGVSFLSRQTLLMLVLLETAKKDPANKTRVISLSSGAQHPHSISFDTFKGDPARRQLTTEALYAQSKFGTVVCAKELARRYGDAGIVSLSMNPGNVNTNLHRRVTGAKKSMISWMLHLMVPNGIVTHLYAGTARETADCDGKYLIPWARVGKPRDPAIGEELWNWLEAQVAGR
ncbi:NAD-P-binding protein [Amylostereum chailletii]|nr:NAD-P-binding protein [Amylostereum chailletii]